MKLIVGLGNPGKEYEQTRHNVGFMVLDEYCKNDKFQNKMNGLYVDKMIDGQKVIFLKPLSYMNLSGDVVESYSSYYKIEPQNILVIRDDLDIELGSGKIKFNSSSGGDNGIKSIIERLHTQSFTQLKIGISNDKKYDTKDYVLGRFSKSELEEIDKMIQKAQHVIDDFIREDVETTMSKNNGLLK